MLLLSARELEPCLCGKYFNAFAAFPADTLVNTHLQDFAKARGATYPVLAKVDVNGFGTIPLYKFLKDKQGGGLGISAIKWNFTKYVRVACFAPLFGLHSLRCARV